MNNEMTSSSITYMKLLSSQMDEIYCSMKEEKQMLYRWEDDKDFSILGVLELFSGDVQGYVESLAFDQSTYNIDSALSHLHQLNAFQLDYFAAWYFENWKVYPQTKLYVEQLDHIRLLLIEHLTVQVPLAVAE